MIWQLRQNNLEDLYELKNDDEVRLFSESEIEITYIKTPISYT